MPIIPLVVSATALAGFLSGFWGRYWGLLPVISYKTPVSGLWGSDAFTYPVWAVDPAGSDVFSKSLTMYWAIITNASNYPAKEMGNVMPGWVNTPLAQVFAQEASIKRDPQTLTMWGPLTPGMWCLFLTGAGAVLYVTEREL